jgi:tetratricopeptide (TPR) repeat protein
VLYDQSKWAEAETLYRETLAMCRKLYRNDTDIIAVSFDDLITVLVVERKDTEAEQVFNDSQAAGGSKPPNNIHFLRLQAFAQAQTCRFAEAIATVQHAIAIDPADHELWHWLAVLLVQTGQLDAYRENCRKSLERFGETTDPTTAHRIAKDCLMLPESGANSETVARMVETSMADEQFSRRRWFQCCKGLAEYRQNHFDSAANWMSAVLTNGGSFLVLNNQAYMVLAMSQWRLQHFEQARAALAAGTKIEPELGTPSDGNLGEDWVDRIIAYALAREAKALIEGDAKVADHPR